MLEHGCLTSVTIGEPSDTWALAAGALVSVLPEYMPDDERSIDAVYPNRGYLPLKVRVFLDALSTAVTSEVMF